MMGNMGDMGTMGWGMGFGWIVMILFWVLVIVGIVSLVRWLSQASSKAGSAASTHPLEILRERYARGEINHDEFEQKRRDLDLVEQK